MYRIIVFMVSLSFILVVISGVFYLGYRYGHWVATWELYGTVRDYMFKGVGSMLVS